jgi:hypothetical protein
VFESDDTKEKIMPRDAAGKRVLAQVLREDGIMKAEQGKLDDSIRLLDASKAWKSAAKHDAKLDRREGQKSERG